MKRKFYILLVLLSAVSSKTFAREDAYNKMAKEFSESAALLPQPKIAIMPFIYLDGRKSDGGPIVSERLTTRIVKLKKFQVIERQLLEKVLAEQNLGTTGIIDVESTKKLGKILGVSAIITGTLLDVENQMVEINARLINTETAEVIATSSVEIKKIWSDVPTSQPQQPATTSPAQQQPSAGQPSYYQPATAYKKGDSFFDIFLGGGAGTMDISFENNLTPIYEYELALDINGNGTLSSSDPTYYKVSFEDLETEKVGLLWGLRMVGFPSEKLLGFEGEISHYAQQITAQQTTINLNGTPAGLFNFYADDYIKVNTYLMAFDLLFRLSSKTVQPYIGLGIGLTLNNTTSPYIYQFYGTTWKKPLDQLSVGFLFRIPIGIRIKIGESTSAFFEYRSAGNLFTFTRNIKGETDIITLTTSQTIFGLGFGF